MPGAQDVSATCLKPFSVVPDVGTWWKWQPFIEVVMVVEGESEEGVM